MTPEQYIEWLDEQIEQYVSESWIETSMPLDLKPPWQRLDKNS